MKSLFRKYWLLIVILFFLPLLGLHIWGCNKPSEINISDTLISAIFTYYGTIVLGFVALLQSDKITEISTRSAKIEEIKLCNQFRPLIDIFRIEDVEQSELKFEDMYKNGFGMVKQIHNIKSKKVYVVLKNYGNASAYNVKLYDYGYVGTEELFNYKERLILEIKKEECILHNINITNTNYINKRYGGNNI